MIRLKRDRRLYRPLPLPHRLARGAVDEIDGHIKPGLARPADSAPDLPGRMPPVERREHRFDGRLHAEGDSCEPGVCQLKEDLAIHRFGIRLGGGLRPLAQAESGVEGGQHRAQPLWVEHRGRPAAEEHGVDQRPGLTAPKDAAAQGDLPRQGFGEVRRRSPRPEVEVGVRVEIAVPASDGAKRHVDVRAQPAGDVRVRQGAVLRRLFSVGKVSHGGKSDRESCGRPRLPAVRSAS